MLLPQTAGFGNPSKSMNGSTRRGFLSLMMSQSNGLFIDNAGARREIYYRLVVVVTTHNVLYKGNKKIAFLGV